MPLENKRPGADKARAFHNYGPGWTATIIGCVQADVVMRPITDLPSPGATLLTDETIMRVGGAGANAALAAAELGMPVRLIGCIGEDPLGSWMRGELSRAGLADELVTVEGETTGVTVALESPARDRTFLTYLGVNARWGLSAVSDGALTCQNLLLCDYFVAPALRGRPALQLLSTARGRGARTFFDTAWDPDGFPSETRAEVSDLLPLVDVFLPNEVEACALADQPGDPAGAGGTLQLISGGWVVIKRGPQGCLALGPGGAELDVAVPSVRVTDTTGAGDAFNAALIHALASGADWPDALAAANEFASTIISRPSDDRYRVGLTEARS